MQRREDFEGVFAASLSAFLAQYVNWRGAVKPPTAKGLVFRQNAWLNVVYPAGLGHRHIVPLTREFGYAGSPLRRWLQAAYVALATRAPFERLFSPAVFTLTNAPEALSCWVFMPGNHTIRAIDTANNISIVFPKKGFDPQFFVQDAKMRQQFGFLPAPKLLEVQEGWFKEERVIGLPLNRVADAAQRRSALAVAISALTQLRAATAQEVDLHAWATELDQQISALVAKTGDGLAAETSRAIAAVQTGVQPILGRAEAQNISICQSHGDFQPANILVAPQQVYLIDWEYSAPRMAHYDFLVHITQSRFASGLGARLHTELARRMQENGLNGWGAAQPGYVPVLFALFILEDLLLKLAENAAPAILAKGLFLDPWLEEVAPFVKTLASFAEPAAA